MKWTVLVALFAGLTITSVLGAPVRGEFPYPSDVIVAGRILERDNGGTFCAVYARTFIQYKSYPARAPGCAHPRVVSSAGWRMSKVAPDTVASCYTHVQCVTNNPANEETARWYPGHRLSVSGTTLIGQDIKDRANSCPAGGGRPLPTDTIVGILASAPCDTDTQCIAGGFRMTFPVYGFDADDPDGNGPNPPQAVTANLPCGLPYKLVAMTLVDETAKSERLRHRLFKVIVFEHWFELYWRYDPNSGRYYSPGLLTFPGFSAIPAFPRLAEADFDRRFRGGGTLRGTDVVGANRQALRILLEGNYTLEEGLLGRGLIYVKGNLTIRGPLQYRGVLIVDETLELLPEGGAPEPLDRRAPPD